MEEGGPSLAITKNAARIAVVAGPTTQRMPSPVVIAFHAMMVGCCPPSALVLAVFSSFYATATPSMRMRELLKFVVPPRLGL